MGFNQPNDGDCDCLWVFKQPNDGDCDCLWVLTNHMMVIVTVHGF